MAQVQNSEQGDHYGLIVPGPGMTENYYLESADLGFCFGSAFLTRIL